MADVNNSPEQQDKPVSASDRRLQSAQQEGIISAEKTDPPKPKPDTSAQGNEGKNGEEGKDKLPAAAAAEELDDARLMQELNKRGISAKSLDELKPKPPELTDEQKLANAQEKREKAVQFGIRNKIFSQAEYDAHVKFTTQKAEDVVKSVFIASLKKEDPDISDEDAEDAFNEKYFVLEKEGTTKHKLGQKAIQSDFEILRREKFGKVETIETLYDEVEQTEQRTKLYKAQVDDLFAKRMPDKITLKLGTEEYHAPVDAALLNQIKKDYLTMDSMEALLDQTGKVNEEVLKNEILKDYFWNNRDAIFSAAANANADKRLSEDKKGRKGIVDLPADDTPAAPNKALSPAERRMQSVKN